MLPAANLSNVLCAEMCELSMFCASTSQLPCPSLSLTLLSIVEFAALAACGELVQYVWCSACSECGNIVCCLFVYLFVVVVASANFIVVVVVAATCAIFAFLLDFAFCCCCCCCFVLFRFQQLIDTSAFSMVHDIKVLNLTAKTASRKVAASLPICHLPLVFCLLPLVYPTAIASMALNPCAHNWTLPSALNCLQKSRPTFQQLKMNTHWQSTLVTMNWAQEKFSIDFKYE